MSTMPVLLPHGYFQRMTRLELSLAVDKLASYLRSELDNGIFPGALASFLRNALVVVPYIYRTGLEKSAAVDIFSQPVSGCALGSTGLRRWLKLLRAVATECAEARESGSCPASRRVLLALSVFSLLTTVAPVLEAGYLVAKTRESGSEEKLPEVFLSAANIASKALLHNLAR